MTVASRQVLTTCIIERWRSAYPICSTFLYASFRFIKVTHCFLELLLGNTDSQPDRTEYATGVHKVEWYNVIVAAMGADVGV